MKQGYGSCFDTAKCPCRSRTGPLQRSGGFTLVPTDYNNNNAPGGGAHNLVRFLENWSGQDFSYVGSMVQTYISQQYQGL